MHRSHHSILTRSLSMWHETATLGQLAGIWQLVGEMTMEHQLIRGADLHQRLYAVTQSLIFDAGWTTPG
jgi:hypothetical protein